MAIARRSREGKRRVPALGSMGIEPRSRLPLATTTIPQIPDGGPMRGPFVAVAIGALALTLTPASQAATCRTKSFQEEQVAPHIEFVQASGIPCWHVTHPETKGGAGYVEPSLKLGEYCPTVVDCVDDPEVLRRAASEGSAVLPPAGEWQASRPYRVRVTVHWEPCAIKGVYPGGCGRIRAVPERWACSAVDHLRADNEAFLEWLGVTCRRGRATVYVRM